MISKFCRIVLMNILRSRQEQSSESTIYVDLKDFIPKNCRGSNDALILPNFIIWDPIHNLSIDLFCPLCTAAGYSVKTETTNVWQDAANSSVMPRTIVDSGWYTLLIGRMYSCSNGHCIASYHAGIMKQLPISEVQFYLSQRSGVTVELFDSIVRMTEAGINFHTIENIYKKKYYDQYLRRKSKSNDINTFPEFECVYKSLSNDFIHKCFVISFEKHKNKYLKTFKDVPCESVSIDHTFKAAANIGYREQGQWMKVYNTLFIVMNEVGKVKAFKLTQGTSLDKVHDVLASIASENARLKYIFTDNCCIVRDKLQLIFPGSEVKLDLFHAVARLTNHMPKRHPFFNDAVKEIGLLFRKSGDYMVQRIHNTAVPNVIEFNLNKYLSRWKPVNHRGWYLINAKVEKEFVNLLKHVRNNCLSEIPSGHGTNRNENLHRHLKGLIRNRMSIQTAEAILTHMFYLKNCQLDGVNIVPPIWSLEEPLLDSTDLAAAHNATCMDVEDEETTVGSVDDQTFEADAFADHDYCYSFSKLVLNLSKCLNTISQNLPKFLTEKFYRYQGFTTLPTTTISIDDFFSKMSRTENLPRNVFLKLMGDMSFRLIHCLNIVVLWSSMLEQILLADDLDLAFRNYIDGIGEPSKEFLVTCIAEEFQGERSDLYLEEHRIIFLQQRDLNAVPSFVLLSMFRHIFQVCLILVPSINNFPMLPLLPKRLMSCNPLYVYYDGENFYVLQKLHTPQLSNQCKCGLTSKDEKLKHCVRTMRCSCVKANQNCSFRCRCVRCGNSKPSKTSRRRTSHMVQPYLSTSSSGMLSKTSFEYLLGTSGEDIIPKISRMQHFLLEAVLFIFLTDNNISFDTIDQQYLTSELYDSYIQLIDELRDEVENTVNVTIDRNALAQWLSYRFKKHALMKQLCS